MTEVELSGVALPAEQPPLPRHANPYDVYLDSLGNDESRRAMAGCLDRIARLLATELAGEPVDLPEHPGRHVSWGRLRYEDTMKIRAALLRTGHTPAYVNKHLAALRRVLKHAWKLGLIVGDDYHRAIDLDPAEGSRLPAGRNVGGTELDAMMKVCVLDDSPAGLRDAALLAFLQSTGGRRAEAASARREEYDPGTRTLRIIGKRDKERELDIHEQAAVYLGRWLALAGRSAGPIFCPIDRWGNRADKHLTPGAIAHIVGKRRMQAGLPTLSPHDFRRTFVGDLLDAGVDLSTAQRMAGHSTPATTAKYDRRPRRTRKAAVEKLSHLLPSPESLRTERAAGDPMSENKPQRLVLVFEDYPEGDLEVFADDVRRYGGVRVADQHWDCSVEPLPHPERSET